MLQQPVKFLLLVLILASTAVAPGCIAPKKYQPNKPFVFSTTINIQGNLPPSEKQDLKSRLENQLDDSLKTLLVTAYPGRILLQHPPVFDTNSVHRSKEFMGSLLNSLGYYKAMVYDSVIRHPRSHKDQLRVSVVFYVYPGKGYKFDSIVYQLQDSALQSLAMARRANSLLKKGAPYSVDVISEELDRLVDLFRNQGYYKFNKEDLLAERDTVFAALINPSLDPFERIALLQEAKRRQQNPAMNVLIKLRNPADSAHFRKYFIRNVTVYPDLDLLNDSAQVTPFRDSINGVAIYSKYNKFRPTFIESKMGVHPNDLFRQRNFLRTYSNYSQLPAWAQVSIETTEAKDSNASITTSLQRWRLGQAVECEIRQYRHD